jgi:four helix bundle protein
LDFGFSIVPNSNIVNELELKDRTRSFGLAAIMLCEGLPDNRANRVLTNQLMRSATSVGANYRAVCRARSSADMIAKLGIVEEEADESAYWLECLIDLKREVSASRSLLGEANELVAIMVSSRRTLQSKIKNQKSKIPLAASRPTSH